MKTKINELKGELAFNRFKKIFLLEFTRQLIKNSTHAEIIKLQTLVEKESSYPISLTGRERIREIIKRREEIDDPEEEGTPSIMRPSIGMFESQEASEINIFENSFKKEELRKEKQRRENIVKVTPILKISEQPRFKRQEMPRKLVIQRTAPQPDPFRKIELLVQEPRLPPHIQYLKPTQTNKQIELGKLNPLINDPGVRAIECYGPDQNIGVKGKMGEKKTGIILTKEEISQVIQIFSKETKIPVQEGIFRVVSGKLSLMAVISHDVGTKFTINKLPQENPTPNLPPQFIQKS